MSSKTILNLVTLGAAVSVIGTTLSCKGPRGPEGPAGSGEGATGATGAPGATGDTGPAGVTGTIAFDSPRCTPEFTGDCLGFACFTVTVHNNTPNPITIASPEANTFAPTTSCYNSTTNSTFHPTQQLTLIPSGTSASLYFTDNTNDCTEPDPFGYRCTIVAYSGSSSNPAGVTYIAQDIIGP